MPHATRGLLLAAVALVALAPPAQATHPYSPDYPAACALENETVPDPSDPTGTGSYHCVGAVYTHCDGTDYVLPCRVCLAYDYQYGHVPTPHGTHTYTQCQDTGIVAHGPPARPPATHRPALKAPGR